jgi:hypothetical protein
MMLGEVLMPSAIGLLILPFLAPQARADEGAVCSQRLPPGPEEMKSTWAEWKLGTTGGTAPLVEVRSADRSHLAMDVTVRVSFGPFDYFYAQGPYLAEAGSSFDIPIELPPEAMQHALATDYLSSVSVRIVASDDGAWRDVRTVHGVAAWVDGAGAAPTVWTEDEGRVAAPNRVASSAVRAALPALPATTNILPPIPAVDFPPRLPEPEEEPPGFHPSEGEIP